MRAGGTLETSMVSAAQAGDRRALDELVTTSLPLVYSIVRRALDGHDDVDDVVQDVMVRVLGRLGALRRPESFRSWLTAITVHQVGTHLHRRRAAVRRSAPLDEAAGVPDPTASFEDVTALRADLSAQRRQVVHAGHWMDPDDRVLLSLWLLELAGELTRAEVAAAINTSVAHAGVRVQRMRQQLEVSRELVAVLERGQRCAGLDAAMTDWDGVPSPLWRKRLARHIRSCGVCAPAAAARIPVERLLLALLPVPAGLAVAVLAKSAAALTATSSAAAVAVGASGTKAGLLGQLVQTLVAHPIVASVAACTVAVGATVTVTNLPGPAPRSPRVVAAPPSAPVRVPPPSTAPAAPSRRPTSATTPPPAATPSAKAVVPVPGRPVSLESAADRPGQFVTTVDGLGVLTPVPAGSDATLRRQATFTAVAGLADPACLSFQAPDGRYLRHSSWRLRLDPNQGTALFRGDATFCARPGTPAGTITLEASNYPGWFIRPRAGEVWVDQTDGTAAFRAGSSFRARPGLAD
ncbi:sigma-70 family RNA polymerase sigma factor [Actinoplanes sp. NPDC026623]|uniref:sigma-70 family RNA polymerase sigma factor n=1 Tax=Actinoplanes sp. NPDC026623 TaxID=3155610 RepID=UPI0033E6B5E5